MTDTALPSLAATADAEPWELYEALCSAGRPVWDAGLDAWVVASYDLVKEMGRADDVLWEGGWVNPPFGLDYDTWVGFVGYGSLKTPHLTDGQEHAALHRWWMRIFSGRTLRHLGDELVRPFAHAAIDGFAGRGHAELAEDFAAHVAPRVVAAAMGFPAEDDAWLERMLDLHRHRMALLGSRARDRETQVDPGLVERGLAAVEELGELVRPIVTARRAAPADDVTSLIWRDAPELFGAEFDDVDVISMVNVAFAGGSESTASAMTSALYLLLTQPALQDTLRGDDAAIANFVEESLRLYNPSAFRPRFAKDDLVLGGVPIKQGDKVIAVYAAGSRDPGRYEAPEHVDLGRRGLRDHFAFGHQGPRTCPGQGLARTQVSTMVSACLERLGELRLDPEREPPRYSGAYTRSWRPLHATFTAA
jgi:cytochrome P450